MTDPFSGEKPIDKYVLPRNELEGGRLQNQHQLLTEVFDGRLIVDKTVKLKGGDRVLDSGTGAASWILDLMKIAPPGVEAVGIDLSSAMFPRDIPKNVSLHEMSSLNLPSSWDNSFDLVSQRLLIAAFTKEQWQTDISELFRVLKPGGSIQLTELDPIQNLDESVALPKTGVCQAYCDAVWGKRNLLGFDCRSQLPTLLKDAGLVDIHLESRKVPLGKQWGKLGVMGAQNWAGLFRAMGRACLEEGGFGLCGSQEEAESAAQEAKREWDEIPGVYTTVFAITGRKPL